MEQYIPKSALVAEIMLRIDGIEVSQKAGLIKKRDAETKIILFKSILSLIDTLEVKEPELTWKDISVIISIDQQVCGKMGISDYVHNHQKAMEEVLKCFKAQKGEKV